MPTYIVGSGNNSLPQRTRDYLANGASKGSRHNEFVAAVGQFRDARYSMEEAAAQCVPRAVKDGLDEKTYAQKIPGIYRRGPRERARKPEHAEFHIVVPHPLLHSRRRRRPLLSENSHCRRR